MRHPFRWRVVSGVLLCAGLLFPVASAQAPNAQQPALLLEEATKKALVDGDLKGAIDTCQRILKLEGVPRAVTAKALLHLGQCSEKLGNVEARRAYERLVREFADQPEEANTARGRLAALGGRDSSMRVRQVWTGPADDLLGGVTNDGRYLTLQDWDSQNLAVRDLVTGQLRKLTDKSPSSLEFALLSVPSPDGREVAYAWYNTKDRLDVRVVGMDGSNLRVLRTDSDLAEQVPVDWSPDSKSVLAVVNERTKGAQILLLSPTGGAPRVLKSFAGNPPGPARFSPDGRFIAYSIAQQPDSPSQDIYVFAADGERETPAIRHAANDVVLGWSPDGKRLLFGSDRNGTMGAWWIQMAHGQPVGAPELIKPDLGQDVRPLGFARDGSFFYEVRTGMSDAYTAAIDFVSGRVLASPVPVTERFAGSNSAPDWSPDGRQLAFLSRRGPGAWAARTICVRDTGTGEVREIPSQLTRVVGVRWFPDGRALLAAARGPRGFGAFRVAVDTGEYEAVDLVRPAPVSRAAWSRDGKIMFYQQWGAAKTSNVAARDVATGQETVLHTVTQPAVYVSGVTLSPDGQQLAFVVRDRGGALLTVIPVGGGEARVVLRSNELAWPNTIAWAPDSQGLLFVKLNRPGNPETELWLVSIQGSEPRRLGLTAPNMREIRVHPDGRHLAFTSGGDRSEVWVMENFLRPAK